MDKINAVRIVVLDSYMSSPNLGLDATYSEFRGSSIIQVPIIRIFGSTDTGKKMCLHIHGVFPYFYVPYDGSENVNSLMYQIAANIDKAINISFGQASSNAQHVYKICLVSGKPFYGYHPKKHQFLKIYLYNPVLIRKVSNLLQNESISGKIYQPHESHIPFTQQFMIDYNLHGMSHIFLSNIKLRTDCNTATDSPTPQKLSLCELEGDALSENILNRLNLQSGKLSANPGIAALWEDEKQRRRNKNDESQISPCLSLSETSVAPTNSHLMFKQALIQKLVEFSTHIDTKIDNNVSVYPAETPDDNNILDASSSIDLNSTIFSQNDTLNESLNITLNQTLVDEVDKNLFDLLLDLRENINAEEGSILSQVKEAEDEEDNNLFDLSLPMAALATPMKIDEDKRSEGFVDSALNVPQLDGNFDDSDDNSSNVKKSLSQGSNLRNFEGGELNLQKNSRNKSSSKKNSSKYVALPISLGSTSKSVTRSERMIKKSSSGEIQSDQELSFSQISIENRTKSQESINIYEKVKRKLSFANTELHSTTVVDERLVCNYKGKKLRKSVTFEVPLIDNKKLKTKSTTPSNKINKPNEVIEENNEINDEILNDYFLSGVDSCNNLLENNQIDSKIDERNSSILTQNSFTDYAISPKFSTGSDNEKLNITQNQVEINKMNSVNLESFKCEENNALTKAQLYDMQTNFKAVEGTSKKISQTLSDADDELLESQQKSSTSSSDFIPPYQTDQQKNEETNSRLFQSLSSSFCLITPETRAPNKQEVIESLDKLKIPKIHHQKPFYSNVDDVTGIVEVGHNILKISSKNAVHAPEFNSTFKGIDDFRRSNIDLSDLKWTKNHINNLKLSYCQNKLILITPNQAPPSRKDVEKWINQRKIASKIVDSIKQNSKQKIYVPKSPENSDEDSDLSLSISFDSPNDLKEKESSPVSPILGQGSKKRKPLTKSSYSTDDSCRITGATLNNTYGFKLTSDNYQKAKAVTTHQFLTILIVELHIRTRGDFKPNPEYDSIQAIFFSLFNDIPDNFDKSSKTKGIIAVNSYYFSPSKDNPVPILDGTGVANCDIIYVQSENELFKVFVGLLQSWDPDILAGYEIEMLSWGYIIERSSVLGINILPLLSRIKPSGKSKQSNEVGMTVTGRIVLDVWRLLRHEISTQSYTFENVVYHILHRRVPLYSFKDLSFWWDHKSHIYRHRTVEHYSFRVEAILQLLDQLDLIGRTSELARLFGIQFFEVLSRGSQFRVESMMLRLAKPLNYIPVSPSVQQRAKMRAPEFLPLILEPESKMYVDPVIVLDFQSLYPSMIIAYNYCFSTCIGRVEFLGKNKPFEFGATQLKISRNQIKRLVEKDYLNFSPCGVGFVKSKVRDGILPRMLREILDTRLMVKNSMKDNKDDKTLKRVLHNRQLGLKLIANVTYGYTAANFSGRMPSVEVGDSVLSKARETLQRAIQMVENTPEWGAKVVYGDTDSLFVLVPGKNRKESFEIGQKIADAVTNDNPKPVKLKLEKVYQPCILQTKKRYVGYMYESSDQVEPVYDAKGIETVRRDGCPAVSKMLEKCLRLLFETKNVSLVKEYVLRQFGKILTGRVNLQDLTFAKEYRGSSGYKPGACVPALELARKWTAIDKRCEPRSGERVPYIIANGPPGLPLIRLVRSPREFLKDPSLRPNALYYITKVIIPPINRCFNLIGADLAVWFNQMPRKQIQYLPTSSSPKKKFTISQYFSTTSCASCGQQTQSGLCDSCKKQPQLTTVVLVEKVRIWEKSHYNTRLICEACSGISGEVNCISLDCPVLYRLAQTEKDLQQVPYVRQLLDDF